MGRNKHEGQKNLAKLVDNPRYTRVFFTKDNRRLPMLVSNASYELIVAGFERRGFKAEKANEQV